VEARFENVTLSPALTVTDLGKYWSASRTSAYRPAARVLAEQHLVVRRARLARSDQHRRDHGTTAVAFIDPPTSIERTRRC
jgi:hypothetical protein